MLLINIRPILFYLLFNLLSIVSRSLASDYEEYFGEDFLRGEEITLLSPCFPDDGYAFWQAFTEQLPGASIPAVLQEIQALPNANQTGFLDTQEPHANQDDVQYNQASNTNQIWPTAFPVPSESQVQTKAPAQKQKRPFNFTFEDNTPRQSDQHLICPTCDQRFLVTDKAYWQHRETCTTAQEGGPQRKRPRTGSLSARATAHTTQAAAPVRGMDPQAGNFLVVQNFQFCQGHIAQAPYPQPQLPYNPQNWAGQNIPVQPQIFACSWSEQGTTCNQQFYRDDELARHVKNYHLRTCKFLVQIHNQWQPCLQGPFASQDELMNHIAEAHTDTN